MKLISWDQVAFATWITRDGVRRLWVSRVQEPLSLDLSLAVGKWGEEKKEKMMYDSLG